ncbi:MAG: RNA polymerase sigma factor [Pirellulales bacterium]|nr:RNA polymerase sigma factor [Pirellulales bacterium]
MAVSREFLAEVQQRRGSPRPSLAVPPSLELSPPVDPLLSDLPTAVASSPTPSRSELPSLAPAASSQSLPTIPSCWTGEELAAIWDAQHLGLILYARQWCQTPEDVAQESFWQLACLAERPQDPTAWLYRAVRNRAISALRGEIRRRQHEANYAQSRPEWFCPSTAAGPWSAVEVQAALQKLSEQQREMIVLHLWSGLTFEQIATVTNTSGSTAHRQYAAGLQALRKLLQ